MNRAGRLGICALAALAVAIGVAGCGESDGPHDPELTAQQEQLTLNARQKQVVVKMVNASKGLGRMEGICEGVDDIYAIGRRIDHASQTSSSFKEFGSKMLSVMDFIDRRIRAHTAQIKTLTKESGAGDRLQVSAASCRGSENSAETQLPARGVTDEPVRQERDQPTAAQIREVEEAVRDELPSIPLWEKATFHGVATEDGDVCVDRYYSKESADVLGGGRSAGYVVVVLPGLTTSEPKDGKCGRPLPDPGERLSPEELDGLAKELIAAIEAGDAAETVSTAKRIKASLDKPVPMMTYEANLIHSATVAAIEGVQTDAPNQVDAALRFLNEALDGSE